MSGPKLGHGILKYFCPITHKMNTPEDKDPPEGKELPKLFGLYIYIEGYRDCHRDQLPAVLNADITRVLKQVKRSFTKNCYMKLTPAKRCEIYKLSSLTSTL